MKKFGILLMFVLLSNLAFSQKKAMSILPILFDTVEVDVNYQRKLLEIKDTLFSDTVRIGFKVTLEFKYPLNDTTYTINLKSIKLRSLEIKSLKSGTQYRIDLIRRNRWSEWEKDIWNRYSEIFNYWYRNQPYEKMIDRQAYGNKAFFGGILYAIP